MTGESVVRGFDHVAMKAKDFEKSVQFYTQVLGFRQAARWGDEQNKAAMLDMGNKSYLEIFSGGADDAPEGTLLHIALKTDDCDAATARVRAAGARITMEPQTIAVNGTPKFTVRIAFFKGPDGEIIEFVQKVA